MRIQLSDRAIAEAGRFFREHPVVELAAVPLSAESLMTQCVPVGDGRCDRCGALIELGPIFRDELAKNLKALGEEMPRGTLPEGFLRDLKLTHGWDQASRSVYCGGAIVLEGATV